VVLFVMCTSGVVFAMQPLPELEYPMGQAVKQVC